MLKAKINFKTSGLFLIVPLLSLVQISSLTYGSDILRLSILLLFTIVVLIIYRSDLKFKSVLHIIPFLLILVYFINQLLLNNDITSFLLGRYNRFGGFITLTCLAIYFIISSNQGQSSKRIFSYTLYTTYLIMLSHGLLTYSGILPNDTYFDGIQRILVTSSDLSLTFGNPNIASAFLGICISIHILLILFKIHSQIFIQIFILFLALFLILKTNSIQGWLIIFFNMVIILLYLYRENSVTLGKKIKTTLKVLSSIFIVIIIFGFRWFWDYLYINGSVEARINYWKASIRIWNEYKFTGVGLDNLGEVSTFYRDFDLAKQEGLWTIPDRTHNVILDHLVNGGIFALILWLTFISVITFFALLKLFGKFKVSPSTFDVAVILVWFGYLLQSLISVDHMFLTLIGYISAGLIFGDYLGERKNQNSYEKTTVPLFLFTLVALAVFTLNQLSLSLNVNQFLSKGNTKVLDKLYKTNFVEQQSFLDIVVKLSGDKQFKLASLFADKLLIVNPYAHQAYYAKSVFYESEKDLTKAKLEMEKAHTYDKFNSVYTLSLGIYEYNLKNYPKAYYWLDETVKLNPTQQGIEILKNLLDQLDS